MKFPYHVKHNGVDYKPFEEIDMGAKAPVSSPIAEDEKVDSVSAKKRVKKDKE